jgi:hypothetical protein
MKTIQLDTIPEEVNGMKTRLFAKYLNWFNRTVSPSRFYFNHYMVDRPTALMQARSWANSGGSHENRYALMLKTLDIIKPIKDGHCDSVGCFTGHSINCKDVIPCKKAHITEIVDVGEFAGIMGINNRIAEFMFMPDRPIPWPRLVLNTPEDGDIFRDIGVAKVYINKREMVERCVKFLNYVVAGKIDPNPTARMTPAEADNLS